MNTERITVIIPVFNVAPWLPACIDSVLAQTYLHTEIILVNDGSTDTSGQICDTYAARNARVHTIHQKNRGLSCARNAGLDVATGAYVAFVDADDTLAPCFLDEMHSLLQKNDTGLCICNFQPFMETETGEIVKSAVQPLLKTGAKIPAAEVLELIGKPGGFLYVSSCNKLYRAGILDTLRFPAGKLHEDEFFIHHVLWRAGTVTCTDAPLYNRRIREESITTTQYSLRRLDALEAMEDRVQFIKGQGASFLLPTAFRRYINTYAMAHANLPTTHRENKVALRRCKKQLRSHRWDILLHTSIATVLSYCAVMAFPSIYHRAGLLVARK